ncbi:2-oxoacid:acceptor oxidoreductase family protein [Bacillus marinisedimentorum]|uniref:2-oxoacid:acceptor oxidoreductase family protein n=1 Tax=Bacillus marinisedimentorum TaxID=1821260 RepID=UPI0007DF8FBD|nr:2-oxoacid:acceptor oxidoreductase family protein [Bacillus marinisedimentorum]
MKEEIVIAGFGGQGVMTMGQLLAYAGMIQGKEVSWLPSYGPEQRGGTANVQVVISDDLIGSPIFTYSSSAIVLNNPSFHKFEPLVRAGGVLVVNRSLVDSVSERQDLISVYIPATEAALELGEAKTANIILLGALLELTGAADESAIIGAMEKLFSNKNPQILELNKKALEKGMELAAKQQTVKP